MTAVMLRRAAEADAEVLRVDDAHAASLRLAARTRLLWLAERGGVAAGHGAALPEGRVGLLHVAPAARRQGIGRALLRRVEADLAALGHAEARTDASREARAFLIACGWEPAQGGSLRKPLPAVRRLAPHEADLWRRIRLNALASAPAAFAEAHDDWAARPLGDFAERLASSAVFVAELGGAAVGCAELTPDTTGAAGRGWLESVFVARLARGRGVADALLVAVENAARALGLSELCLDVGAANASARGAYVRAGYAEMAERPDGSEQACEITMRRALG